MVTQLRSKLLVTLLGLLFFAGVQRTAVAQCNTNVSICTPGIAGPFTFSTPGTPVSSCLNFFGPGMGYIMLYITQSGNLNMQIDGNSSVGFLDVAVFNVPSGTAPCNAILNLSNEIGCNYADYASGCNQFGTAFGCTSSVPAPYVTAGQVLMILVENWSGSSSNFTLQLGTIAGSAQTGPPNPAINPAGPFCSSGASTQLTAVNNGGTWSGAGVSASGMFNPATAGLGPHTITYSIGTSPCNASSTTTVTVVSTPSITVSSATICPGGTATLTATPNTAGGTYVWNPGGLTGQSISVSPGTTTTYTCIYSLGGCTAAPKTGTVTVGGAVTLAVNSASVCPGGTATLTVTGGSSYTWSPATGLSATTGSTVTATPTVTTTYTVTNSGCPGNATSTVTVSPGPTVTVNSPSVCIGSGTTLTATGASTYTWSPATGLSATTGSTVTATPTVTTTYTVVGSSAATCTGTTTSTVTVNPLPVVTVNSATICPAGTATLTATGASSYSWTPSTGLSATSGGSVTANPASNTTYTITGTTAGCNGTGTSTVTISALPPVTVTSPTMCAGGSATIIASGASTYTWSPAAGLSATSGSTVTATPSVTTTYTVTGTSAGGCSASATSTVTVTALPTVSVPSATVCAGSGTPLSASGASTYTWSPATGLSATSGSMVTATPAVTTTYTVVGTSSGCSSNTTVTVTVDPLPVVTVNTPTICAGGTATLTANGGTTYTWAPATGLSATSGTSVTANPATTTTYTVTGTTSGCNGVQTTTVTVNPLPTVLVNSAGICISGTATLTASGATSYSWSPSTGLSATSGPTVSANPSSTTIYTVTGTTLGCDGTATSTVSVNSIPVVTVNSPSFCAGSNTTLNATGGTSFSWAPSMGLSSTSGASVTANPSVTTIYTVTETSSGCNGSNTSTVTVNPLPTVTASNTGPYCENQTIQITCTTSATSFTWTGPNSFGASSQSASIPNAVIANGGTYSVTVSDANACQASATTTVVVHPLPVVSISSNSPVCENGTLNLLASGGTGFSWSGPNSFTSVLQNPSLSPATLPMSGSYTVVVTDANSCVNANVTSVTINPKPAAPAVSNVSYCLGASAVPLTATVASGGTLNWYGTSPSGSYSSTPNTPSTSVAGASTYYVSQTVTGCEGSQAAISVVIKPLPTATLNAIPPKCVPLCDNFILSSSSTIVSSSWDMGNGVVNANNDTLNHCYSQSGSYDIAITITDNSGCTNVIPFSNWVHAIEIPTAEFTYSPNPISILEPNVTFYNTSIGTALSAASWDFLWNDTLLLSTTADQPTFVFPDIDTFMVSLTVTSTYGCSNTTIKPIIVQDDHAVFIPNAFSPDNDNINEEFKAVGTGIAKIHTWIFNRWGEVIYHSDEVEKGWNGRDKKGDKVDKGVYIYKMEIVDYRGSKTIKTGHVTVVR